MRNIETLIIGGGMAGLGAAHTLHEHGDHNFLLVTKDIGGRVLTSSDGETNYGAFYVRQDYKHLLKFVTREQRIRTRDLLFTGLGRKRRVFSWQNIKYIPSAIKGVYLLLKFFRRYRALRERCERMSPRESLSRDAWLKKLHNQPASDFVSEHGLHYWAKHFLDPVVKATTFLDISQASASVMLIALLPTVIPSWEFKMNIERILGPIVDNIEKDVTTVSVEQVGADWVATDQSGQIYKSRNLILALPITETKKLLALNEAVNDPIRATVVHLKGKLREKYEQYPFVFFSVEEPDIWLTAEDGGTYLFYTQNQNYNLSRYFSDYQVINVHRWDPAFFLGPHVTDIDRGEGLYIIGGHNFASMEDAYISGIYAANRVIEGIENKN